MTEKDEALVLFMPSGRRGTFPHGTPVLDAARTLGVSVESVCGGRGICGRCQISVAEGEFAKHKITSKQAHLSPFSAKEKRYAEKRSLAADRRLSCSALIEGNLVIDVPEDMQANAQLVRKAASDRPIERDLTTRLYYVEVEEPEMDRPLGDLDRLYQALERDWELTGVVTDMPLLPDVQTVLRQGKWAATAAIHHDGDRHTIVGLWPGFHDRLYGIAVDIGSTTIAMHLIDMMSGVTIATAGSSNPQIRFGEDLMSRVSYVMMNDDGTARMTGAVRETLNRMIGEVCAEADVLPSEIMEGVFVGNPVMHHLFLGIDPRELGGAPFALAVSGAMTFPARDIGVGIARCGRVYTLPCIAGHVGADAAAATLAEKPGGDAGNTLLVDIGTNAEIVLGNCDRLVAASSPTGPAFEGAEISCGQRAAAGAIERVRIDPETLEPRIHVIGAPMWSDEPGFDEAVAATGVTGICGSAIIEVIAEMFLAGIITEDGVIDGALAARSDRVIGDGRTYSYVLWRGAIEVKITQNDIRAIQLAKAALFAGIKLLVDRLGIGHVDRIKLAGAFGSFIDPKYAMILGLIPDCDLDQVAAVGNAAGEGARMALLNRGARTEIEETVRRIEKIETALETKFQEHFVHAMALPNKIEPFPKLGAAVTLPKPANPARQDGQAPRRRRRRAR